MPNINEMGLSTLGSKWKNILNSAYVQAFGENTEDYIYEVYEIIEDESKGYIIVFLVTMFKRGNHKISYNPLTNSIQRFVKA